MAEKAPQGIQRTIREIDATREALDRFAGQLGRARRLLAFCDEAGAGEVMTLEEMEATYLRRVIAQMRPRYTWLAVATALGISEKTLWSKRKKHDLP